MKRSEMIQIIASDLIREALDNPHWNVAQEIAEIILKRIEDQGMVPPQIFKGTDQDVLHAYVNQWDNE